VLFRALPFLLGLGLLVYCLIDCVQTPDGAQRNLPKWAWILLILFFPIVGGIAWLVAGRPERSPSHGRVAGFPEYQRDQWGSGRSGSSGRGSGAPDDDPEFLRQLGQGNGFSEINTEHEQTLKRWEDDLRRREAELEGRRPEPPKDTPEA
jgi:hypothetical protein